MRNIQVLVFGAPYITDLMVVLNSVAHKNTQSVDVIFKLIMMFIENVEFWFTDLCDYMYSEVFSLHGGFCNWW